jgi:hypothetical protein
MDQFFGRLKQLPIDQRRAKIDHILNFLKGNPAFHRFVPYFEELRYCYPSFPFFKPEEEFRVYLATCKMAEISEHPALQQVFNS